MPAAKRKIRQQKTGGQLVRLVAAVERILKEENKRGRGKLRDKIPSIKEKQAFFKFPVVFLPARGEVIFIGDTHGDSLSTKAILKQESFFKKLSSGKNIYLVFLGDYADRGKADIKNLEFILNLKKEHPDNVFFLRGNHEELSVGQYYGFLGSCIKLFGYEKGQLVFQRFNELFEKLPGVAVTANGVVALHGGVPISEIKSLKDLDDEEDLSEIRWNDPTSEIDHFVFNYKRGGHYLFGEEIFKIFMAGIGAKVLVRSHEYVAKGFKFMFNNKLLSIFSNGGKSGESGYRDFILNPKYVKVNLAKPIKSWTKQNIINIKY